MLEIGCAWSKGSGERLQGHHGPLVISLCQENLIGCYLTLYLATKFQTGPN